MSELAAGFSRRTMQWSAAMWFGVAIAGQLMFALYVSGFYGRVSLSGNLEGWNRVMPHGYVRGDVAGNIAVGLHLLLAVVMLGGGAVQLVPQIRRSAPGLHRWNGRVYVVAALLTSLAGLYMVWTRGTVGGAVQHYSISVNALLMLAFAYLAWKTARERKFGEHRRWALRLFLVSGGVWFFRIGLMLWLAIHRAPVGFDPKRFEGPFLTALGIGQYVVPLLVLELYLLVEKKGGGAARYAMAGLMVILTAGTGAGILAATLGMWLPRL